MVEPTEVQVIPSPQLLAGLTQLLAVGGPFHLLTLTLFQAGLVVTPATLYADLPIADFSGFAPVASIVFEGPYYDVDNTALVIGAATAFIATAASPFVSNSIGGYALVNAGLTAIAAGYNFQTPVGVNVPGDAVAVVPFLRYSGT